MAAIAALLLLIFMFVLKWYGAPGVEGVNAWHALTVLRWLMLVTIVSALALAYYQASRNSPAIPVSLSVVCSTLGALLTLLLIYRVLINQPGPDSIVTQEGGAYLGLACALGITFGGYLSMRDEGPPADRNPEIETVSLTPPEPGQTTTSS
jgi:hypothetical protein